MNLRQSLSPKQVMTLRQMLNPKMIQMLKTFHLPYSELIEKIQESVDDNMFLDIIRYDQLTDYQASKRQSDDDRFMGRDASDFASGDAGQETLHEYLMSQLDLENLSEKEYEIAAFIIDHIDEKGYIEDYDKVRVKTAAEFDVAERKVNDILKIIQSFEPEGVGARSLKECLLIQIEQYDFENEKLREVLDRVVRNHLDDLAAERFNVIAKSLGIAPDGVQALAEFIRQNLDPAPGQRFSKQEFNRHVIPSFEVSLINGKPAITNLEDTMGIQIGLSGKYEAMLNNPELDEKTRAYLKEKYEAAKELVENIRKRRENLNKLIQMIISRQELFLKKGVFYLEPLLQKTIAAQLDISPSTVSRIVSSKYIQTPHGIFSLKQLCPRSHFGKTSVRLIHIVRDVAAEHPELSDSKIRELLQRQGLDIARRTVAKYRSLAGLASSFERKKAEF